MKTSLKVALTLLALAVGTAAPLVRAQDNPNNPPKPERHREGHPRMDRLKMLVKELGLTEEQQAKIRPIVRSEMEAMRALRDDSSLDRQAKHEKMMELRKTYGAQIRAVLTPEQQAKFDELRKRRPGGPGPGPGAGGPPPGDAPTE